LLSQICSSCNLHWHPIPIISDTLIPKEWPERGEIEIHNLVVKYGSLEVLHGINCHLRSYEKVKSTFTLISYNFALIQLKWN
jgi:hypothetical protein